MTTRIKKTDIDNQDAPVEGTGECSVSWVSTYKEIPTALFDRTFGDDIEGAWWYQALENSKLSDQFQFQYGVISVNGEPVGVAPAFLMDLPLDLVVPESVLPLFKLFGNLHRGALYQRTLFVGSPCADEGTIGLLPGVTLKQIATSLQNAVESLAREKSAEMIAWKDFPEETLPDLEQLVSDHGMFFSTSYPGAAVNLDGFTTFANYVNSLSSNRKANFKKKLKKSRSCAEIKVEVVQAPAGSILEEIFPLFWQTYEKGETKFEKLNLDFFKEIAKVPNSWFLLLRDGADNRLLAFMLLFKLKSKVINKFLGIDYKEDSERFLYYRLWESAIEWAITCGAREFQVGQTGYRPKVELGSKLIPLTNICKHRNPLIHFIYARVSEGITWSTLDKDLNHVLKSHPEYERSCPWKQTEFEEGHEKGNPTCT